MNGKKAVTVDDLEEEIPSLARKAFARAFAEAQAAGHSILTVADGAVYELAPNGKRIFVKRVGKPYPITVGKVIHIR